MSRIREMSYRRRRSSYDPLPRRGSSRHHGTDEEESTRTIRRERRTLVKPLGEIRDVGVDEMGHLHFNLLSPRSERADLDDGDDQLRCPRPNADNLRLFRDVDDANRKIDSLAAQNKALSEQLAAISELLKRSGISPASVETPAAVPAPPPPVLQTPFIPVPPPPPPPPTPVPAAPQKIDLTAQFQQQTNTIAGLLREYETRFAESQARAQNDLQKFVNDAINKAFLDLSTSFNALNQRIANVQGGVVPGPQLPTAAQIAAAIDTQAFRSAVVNALQTPSIQIATADIERTFASNAFANAVANSFPLDLMASKVVQQINGNLTTGLTDFAVDTLVNRISTDPRLIQNVRTAISNEINSHETNITLSNDDLQRIANTVTSETFTTGVADALRNAVVINQTELANSYNSAAFKEAVRGSVPSVDQTATSVQNKINTSPLNVRFSQEALNSIVNSITNQTGPISTNLRNGLVETVKSQEFITALIRDLPKTTYPSVDDIVAGIRDLIHSQAGAQGQTSQGTSQDVIGYLQQHLQNAITDAIAESLNNLASSNAANEKVREALDAISESLNEITEAVSIVLAPGQLPSNNTSSSTSTSQSTPEKLVKEAVGTKYRNEKYPRAQQSSNLVGNTKVTPKEKEKEETAESSGSNQDTTTSSPLSKRRSSRNRTPTNFLRY